MKTFIAKNAIYLKKPASGEDHDPGDESDGEYPPWRRMTFVMGKTMCFFPRSWIEEKLPAMPNHDGGDEDPWYPISELSQRRIFYRDLL